MLRKNLIILVTLSIPIIFSACTKKQPPENSVLHADRNFNFPKGFPPDPGEAGKKTLAGIDSDHDGLRDDVQRWIYARYPGDEVKRRALRQMAMSLQKATIEDYDKAILKKVSETDSKADACLGFVFRAPGNSYLELEYLEAKVFNTKERSKRALKNDMMFSGSVIGGDYPDDGSTCD